MPFAATWMGLEMIILSEVSQKEKDKYHMISLTCGIWNRKQMILSKNTETDHGLGEQTWGSQRGRRREWDGRAFGGFLDANCYTWNGWAMGPYCTAEGTVYDWVALPYNRNWRTINQFTLFIYLFGLFVFSRAAPVACGGSQARGRIGAVAPSLRHGHSNARSKQCLWLIPQLMAMPDP